MSVLDYGGLELKLGRKLTKRERKFLNDYDHALSGLPRNRKKKVERTTERMKNQYVQSIWPVSGGAPGLGKKNSGSTRTMKIAKRDDGCRN